MTSRQDPLARIRHLLTGPPPVDLRRIAEELGIKIWQSTSLPRGVAGKLTNHPRHKPGPSGFAIVVRKEDRPTRKNFTIAHEIAHFLVHLDRLVDGEIVDRVAVPSKELYRSNLNPSMEARANIIASDILMPWGLFGPLMNRRKTELEALFDVSREALDIKLASSTARRLKHGVKIDPVLEAHFRTVVERWRKDTRHTSSLTQMITHPDYKRIIEIGHKVLPLLFRELSERPNHWLVALKEITRVDVAPAGSTFGEAVQAWLLWGRERGYLR